MTSKAQSAKTSSLNSVSGDAHRRKRLGQYFTGDPLSKLLVAIADGAHCRSAIDPMCGSGDMLAAVNRAAPEAELAGIEIDPVAYELCSSRFSGIVNTPQLIRDNAFSWATISRLPKTSFDLVITNPPYVRYQSFAGNSQRNSEALPQSESIRRGLIEIAKNLSGIEDKDRDIFISIILGYSGLSDLAVPSWILCSMLTTIGGRLAMVVPESWLNRNYAYPIHYLLLKLFRIHCVVEDANRAWFDEAQVKTTLIVAERVPRADDIKSACAAQNYFHVAVPVSAITQGSVVAGAFPGAENAEIEFAEMLSGLSNNNGVSTPPELSITRRDLNGKLSDLIATSQDEDWFQACEPQIHDLAHVRGASDTPRIPQALLDLLPIGSSDSLTTIEALGATVGQGLRTGANDFFYCDLISETQDQCLIAPGEVFGFSPLFVPRESVRTVLRKQSELGDGYVIETGSLSGRVLVLERFVHPADWIPTTSTRLAGLEEEPTRVLMPPSLAAFVDAAAQKNVGSMEHPMFIPKMSAVRTNQTKHTGDSAVDRYWYMLPQFAKRHIPDLLIPRVNHLHPRVVMNSPERVIVDANFSTIWIRSNALLKAPALLACLNSSWITAAMELSASILGGGALKLEATHLKRLPIPALSAQQWTELAVLGNRLVFETDVAKALTEINQLIGHVLFGSENAPTAMAGLDRLKEQSLAARRKR